MSSVIVVDCIRSLTLASPHAALLTNRYCDKEKYAVSGETQGGAVGASRVLADGRTYAWCFSDPPFDGIYGLQRGQVQSARAYLARL